MRWEEHPLSSHLVRKAQKDFPPPGCAGWCPTGDTLMMPPDAPLLPRHSMVWTWWCLEGVSVEIPTSDAGWSVPGPPPGPRGPLAQLRTILYLQTRGTVSIPLITPVVTVPLQPDELQVHVTARTSSTLRNLFLFSSLVYNYYQLL